MLVIANDLETLDGELVFKNGDLAIFDSNKEHVSALVDANKGEWKQYPLIGIDLIKYVNSAGATTRLILTQELNKQLLNDGFSIQDLVVEYDLRTNKLNVKTNAERFR
jgi:hypothetical protein